MSSNTSPNHRFSLIKRRATVVHGYTSIHEQEVHTLSLCSNTEARSMLPYKDAVKLLTLPLTVVEKFGERFLIVAVPESTDAEHINALKFAIGCNIQPRKVSEKILLMAIQKAYGGDDENLIKNIEVLSNLDTHYLPKTLHSDLELQEEVDGIPKFLKVFIEYAVSKNASDIHILPRHNGTFVVLRINGELLQHDNPLCSHTLHEHLSRRIKILSGLDINERKLPLDGNFKMKVGSIDVHIRVSSIPTIHGEKIVLRIHGRNEVPSILNLGFNKSDHYLINEALSLTSGLILVCGATGSGKTTTLYSFAKELAGRNKNVATIEDPVELAISELTQTSIDTATNFDYPKAIRAMVRQDPDIIVVGELRDTESLGVCMQASMTGHLVISSLHAGSINEAKERMLMLGATERELQAAIKLVIVQKLEPVLCNECSVIDLQESNRTGETVNKKVGCFKCDYSGYSGRKMIAEVGQ